MDDDMSDVSAYKNTFVGLYAKTSFSVRTFWVEVKGQLVSRHKGCWRSGRPLAFDTRGLITHVPAQHFGPGRRQSCGMDAHLAPCFAPINIMSAHERRYR
jgi:hypothetical protein